MRHWWTWSSAPAIGSALLAVVLYAVTLWGSYVYDDRVIVQEDPRLHQPDGWKQYFYTAYFPQGVDRLYRPLTSLSYALQWKLHGDRPWAFHLVNILLYAAGAALVGELARRLSGLKGAYCAGLLFAAHPLHVEAVANIVGRAELLCCGAMVAGIILFLGKAMTAWRVAALWGCFAVALFSKEQGMLLPFMLAACWLSGTRTIQPSERRMMKWLTAALCWSLAAYIVAREFSALKFSWDVQRLDWTVQPLVRAQGANRLAVPMEILGRYAALLLAPLKLSPDHGGKVIGWRARWDDPYLYFGFLAVAGWFAALAWSLCRRQQARALCLICLGLTYGMISNLWMLIGTNMAERLMYLPSVFFIILLSMMLIRLPGRVWPALLLVLVVLGSYRTISYARQWNDPLEFYRDASRAQPLSVRLRMLVAQELMLRGDLDAAADAAADERQFIPEYWNTWVQSAQIAILRGKFDEAEGYLDYAFRIKDSPPMTIIGLRQLIAQRRSATQPG